MVDIRNVGWVDRCLIQKMLIGEIPMRVIYGRIRRRRVKQPLPCASPSLTTLSSRGSLVSFLSFTHSPATLVTEEERKRGNSAIFCMLWYHTTQLYLYKPQVRHSSYPTVFTMAGAEQQQATAEKVIANILIMVAMEGDQPSSSLPPRDYSPLRTESLLQPRHLQWLPSLVYWSNQDLIPSVAWNCTLGSMLAVRFHWLRMGNAQILVVMRSWTPSLLSSSWKVGTVAAAVNTHIGISRVCPDLLINAGTAGGFRRKGAEIGDVFITTNIRHHDRRIPIPGFEEFSRGHYSSTTTPNLISVCAAVTIPFLHSSFADRNLDTNLGHWRLLTRWIITR